MEKLRVPSHTLIDGLKVPFLFLPFMFVLFGIVVCISLGRYVAVLILAFMLRGLMWVASATGTGYVYDIETGMLTLERRILGLATLEPVCSHAEMVAVTVDVTTKYGRGWVYQPVLVLASGTTVPVHVATLDEREEANTRAAAVARTLNVKFIPLERGLVPRVVVDPVAGSVDVTFTTSYTGTYGTWTPP